MKPITDNEIAQLRSDLALVKEGVAPLTNAVEVIERLLDELRIARETVRTLAPIANLSKAEACEQARQKEREACAAAVEAVWNDVKDWMEDTPSTDDVVERAAARIRTRGTT